MRKLVKESLDLAEVKGRLDNLALELLKTRFPNIDVEPHYRLAEAYVEELLRLDEEYRHDVQSESPLKTLIGLAMDKVASAYALISGKKDKKRIGRLLTAFETMVSDYLESIGFLIY